MALEDCVLRLKDFYRASPAWLKHSVGRLYGLLPMRLRYGRLLPRARRFLDESQWWPWEQHRAYQWERMQRLLRHAYANVAFYRRAMDTAGLTPDDIRSAEDWPKLPLLSKDDVRRHTADLVAQNLRRRTLPTNTGGSTGQPLELYWERGRTRTLERAFMWRQWGWTGFRFGERTAVLRGQLVEDGLWHYDPIDRHLFLNAYDLADEHLGLVVGKLRDFAPASIQAYPSNLTLLASWMAEHGEPPIESVKAILCGSENLYPAQKELFREVFQARVYSWYGHAESCCLAGYCDQEDHYHVYTEYGYTELVDAGGDVLPWAEGQRGEIVATSLINDAMPLIRYRTGDIGVAGPPECSCGRSYPLLARIEGRKQEYVIAADGRAISLTGLVFGRHWHAFARIRQLQLAQDEPGKLVVRIARGAGFGEDDEAEIRGRILSCVPTGLEVSFDYVDRISLTPRGKHVFLKQSLSIPSAWAGEQDAEASPDPRELVVA